MRKYKVKEIVKEISERENSPSTSVYKRFVGLEHYESGNVEIKQSGSVDRLESAMKVFKDGDILIARRNVYLRRAGVVHFSGLTSGDSIVLRPINQEIKDILPFVFNSDSFWDFANRFADGSMSKRLSPKTLMEYEFVLPEGIDLKQLTDLLWAAYDLKESYKKLLVASDEMAKSRFVEMFGDPVMNPHGWRNSSLLDFGECKNGMNFGSNESGISINCLGVSDFQNHSVIRNTEKLPQIHLNTPPRADYLLQDEDIVFVRSNGNKALVGRCVAVYPGNNPTVFSGFCIRFRQQIKVAKTSYLLSVLKSPSVRKQMAGRGANIQNLNQQILASVKIPIPPMELQNEFTAFIEQLDKSKIALQKSIENLDAVIKNLLNKTFMEGAK